MNVPAAVFGWGVSGWPKEDFPFIPCILMLPRSGKGPAVYESQEIFSKLFYIDAYTGEVLPEEKMR